MTQSTKPIDPHAPAEKVRVALEFHLERRDTNNGKAYCVDCNANQRRDGSYKHDPECVVSVAVNAVKEKRRGKH